MAFPTVATTGYGEDGSSVTSHTTPTYPASIASGDLLLLVISSDGNITVTDGLSGWTNLIEVTNTAAFELQVWYKTAAGTESGTFTITTTETERTDFYIARITGWHGTTAPEGATATGTDVTLIDPPNLAPSWGAEDTLWFAIMGADHLIGIPTAAPTDYGNNTLFDGVAATGGAVIGIGTRNLNASSANPGVFTAPGGNDQWVAATVAVRPAGGGGGEPTLHMLSLLGVGK